MAKVAIIGGTGASAFPGLEQADAHSYSNSAGAPSSPLRVWQEAGHEVGFLHRHGEDSTVPPHRVNYRANILALAEWGADAVIALNAVGSIAPHPAGTLVIPHQLVDYTWGREYTLVDLKPESIFIDFTEPYVAFLRESLASAGGAAGVPLAVGGVYGVTQGPRLETAAEIDRLERDGCTLVGMTSMPEAALAREAGLNYACCAVVVNAAAGRSEQPIHAEIEASVALGIEHAASLIRHFLQAF